MDGHRKIAALLEYYTGVCIDELDDVEIAMRWRRLEFALDYDSRRMSAALFGVKK